MGSIFEVSMIAKWEKGNLELVRSSSSEMEAEESVYLTLELPSV